jgi:predicted membrane-bound mannosyltransferase
MAQRPDPKEFKASLLSGEAVSRNVVLERMRGKLAGQSADLMAQEDNRRKVVRKRRFAWGWRTGLAALFLAANAVLVMKYAPEADAMVKAVRKAPALSPSKSLSLDDQALFWTYALYDYGRLVKRFGAPAKAVVSAQEAKAELARLLPKVGARTRFDIGQYLPKKEAGT